MDTNIQNGKRPEPGSGYKFETVAKGCLFTDSCDCNCMIFLLKGRAILNSSEGTNLFIPKGNFCFMPASAEYSFYALEDCLFMIFCFDDLANGYEVAFFKELRGIDLPTKPKLMILECRNTLAEMVKGFCAQRLSINTGEGFRSYKLGELIYVLRTVYTMEDMAHFFHQIACVSYRFRNFVLKNYLKVRTVDELVLLSELKRKVFDRTFQCEFGNYTYKWLLEQKAKHVYYAFSESDDKTRAKAIMTKYGFLTPPHFTRFCQYYFNAAPGELKNSLREARNFAISYYS